MTDKKTDKTEDKTKPEDSDQIETGMFEMMKKCCTGEGAFSDCAAMMKSKMGATTGKPCCGPGAEETKAERRTK